MHTCSSTVRAVDGYGCSVIHRRSNRPKMRAPHLVGRRICKSRPKLQAACGHTPRQEAVDGDGEDEPEPELALSKGRA